MTLAQQCDHYHALPYAGGVLDQPAGLLERMRQALNAYSAMRAYARYGTQAGATVAWANENPQANETVNLIKKLQRLHARS